MATNTDNFFSATYYVPGAMPNHLEPLSCLILTRPLCIGVVFASFSKRVYQGLHRLSQLSKVMHELIVCLDLNTRLVSIQVYTQNHFIPKCF